MAIVQVAVLGATGTAGARTLAQLRGRGIAATGLSRASGVDLLTGAGLHEALAEADAVIDASQPLPSDGGSGMREALAAATRNVVRACADQNVGHLVFLSILGIHDPRLAGFEYYAGKRDQEAELADSPVPVTLVKTTQWHEFATNPFAVSFGADEVAVQDWLVQPVAADSVAGTLADAAVGDPDTATRRIAGPEVLRLPELTERVLARTGDPRPVRSVPADPVALGEGALLAGDDAEILPPDVPTWLAGASG
ncbi:SDR family oxidoreductase [Saccharopolyspora montiporae]|uniref:SDR family oxidoreductase n=1 Tax=Saccharopolyspora montiporae TaxID=2781240 RepID=UPI00351CA2E3